MDNKKHLSEKMRDNDAQPVSIYTMQKWIKEAETLENENKGLKNKVKLLEADKLRLRLALADKILDVRIKYNLEVVRKRLQELQNLLANSKTITPVEAGKKMK